MVTRDAQTKVQQMQGISVEWPDPNTAKFCQAQTKSMRNIYCQKFLIPIGREKLDQSLPKSLKTCYGTMPTIMQNFTVLSQTMYEKCVTKMYSKTRSIIVPNFVPFWQPVYEISAAKPGLFH